MMDRMKKLINLSFSGLNLNTVINAKMEGSSGEALDAKLLEQITELDETHRFFVWLYLPLSVISIDDAIRVQKRIGISDYLFLRKVIIWCRYQNMDLDATIDLLEKKGLTKKDVDDIIIIQETFEADVVFNPLDRKIVDKIIKNANEFVASKSSGAAHSNYPMVDEKNGRPQLGWCKCYHYGCGYRGSCADDLRDHLDQCNAYTAYFHKTHENIVSKMDLTPEKVVGQGITQCPSPVCNKHSIVMTPEQLVYHFKRLGISPFWKEGDKIDYDEENKHEFNVADQKPIFSSKKCVACIDTHPTVLFVGCNHHVLCIGCSGDVDRCPMCQVPITVSICY